jgi:hypothetical protein
VESLGGGMTGSKEKDLDFYIENHPELFSKEDIIRNYLALSKHYKEMMKSNQGIISSYESIISSNTNSIKSNEKIIKLKDEISEIEISKLCSKNKELQEKGKKNIIEHNNKRTQERDLITVPIHELASNLLLNKKPKSNIVSLIAKKEGKKVRTVRRILESHPSQLWKPKDKK